MSALTVDVVAQLVEATYRASSTAEIHQAEAALQQLALNPDYPKVLCQLIVSDKSITVRQSAVSHLRSFMHQKEVFVLQHGVDVFLSLSGSVADEFQPLLELLADCVCRAYAFANGQANLLGVVAKCFESENPLPGAMLLDAFIRVGGVFWVNFKDAIGNLLRREVELLRHKPLYCHYFATSMAKYLPLCDMSADELAPILQIVIEMLNSGVVCNESFDLGEELLQLARVILLKQEDYGIGELFKAVLAYAGRNPSFRGYTEMLRLVDGMLDSDNGYALFSQSDMSTPIMMLAAEAFNVSEDDRMYFTQDAMHFIEQHFPVAFEPDTPREAVIIMFQNLIVKHSDIPLLCLKIVSENMNDDPWQQFKWMNFLSCTSTELDGPQEAVVPLLTRVANQLQSGNPILCVAAFRFLAKFPTSLAEQANKFIEIAFSALTSCEPESVLEFASCCACGRLVSLVKADLSRLSCAGNVINVVFRCSRTYATDAIAQTLTVFISAFPSQFVSLAGDSVTELLNLFEQYMTAEESDTRRSVYELTNAITDLCSLVQNPAILDVILERVCRFIELRYCETFCEEILPLVDGCVSNAQALSPRVASVPEILIQLYQQEGATLVNEIASIMRQLAMKFGELSEPIVRVSTQIVEFIVEDGAVTFEDQEAMVVFSQIIFIIFKRNDCLEYWASIFGQLEGAFLGDVAAAMVQCNPALALQSAAIYQNWIQSATALPFLASVSVWSSMADLPDSVRPFAANIQARIQQHLGELELVDSENVQNADFFLALVPDLLTKCRSLAQ